MTDKKDNSDKKYLTEGEKFIEEFFIEEQITYETFKEIKNLKGDIKDFREADFYLPKFKIYVEFFGQWNASEEHKERYRAKKRAYHINNIPCIYLYPENLGILKYVFNHRIKLELQKKGMKKELLRFNYYQYNQNNRLTLPIATIGTGYLLYTFDLFGHYIYLLFLLFVGLFTLAAIIDTISGLVYYLIIDIRRIKKIDKQENEDKRTAGNTGFV